MLWGIHNVIPDQFYMRLKLKRYVIFMPILSLVISSVFSLAGMIFRLKYALITPEEIL